MKLLRRTLFPLLTAILIFLLMQPYFVWGMSLRYLNYLLYLIIFINVSIRQQKHLLLLGFFLILFAIPAILGNANIFGLINTVAVVFMLFTNQEYAERSYYFFVRIMALTMMISLIVWIMIGLGVPLSGEVIDPLNELKDYNYIAYPFLVIVLDYTGTILNMLRFSGVFDEPGVVGTVTFLILAINRFEIRKWYNTICFIGGILSMSLFFYIGTFIYALLAYVFNPKYNIAKRITSLLIILAGWLVIVNNDTTSELILGRMEYDTTTNKMTGDNRSDIYLDNYIDNIRGSSLYFWGVRNESIIKEYQNSAGYKNAILMYGMVFIVLYIVLFGIYGSTYMSNNKWMLFVMILIMVATLYQRPGFMGKDYIFLFMCLFRINGKTNETQVYKTV